MVERSASKKHASVVIPDAMASAFTPGRPDTKNLVLREWSVSYAYSSFYVEAIDPRGTPKNGQ